MAVSAGCQPPGCRCFGCTPRPLGESAPSRCLQTRGSLRGMPAPWLHAVFPGTLQPTEEAPQHANPARSGPGSKLALQRSRFPNSCLTACRDTAGAGLPGTLGSAPDSHEGLASCTGGYPGRGRGGGATPGVPPLAASPAEHRASRPPSRCCVRPIGAAPWATRLKSQLARDQPAGTAYAEAIVAVPAARS